MKHLTLLIDASASMVGYTEETRKSVCDIIGTLDPKTHLTLVFFDTREYEIIVSNFVSRINPNIGNLFDSRSGTPITDSIYKAIQDITSEISELEHLSEEHKFVIFTDGEENSSHYVGAEDLGQAIDHLTNEFHWDFKFIGPKSQESGIKSYTESIKIKKENVSLYTDVSEGLNIMKDVAVGK